MKRIFFLAILILIIFSCSKEKNINKKHLKANSTLKQEKNIKKESKTIQTHKDKVKTNDKSIQKEKKEEGTIVADFNDRKRIVDFARKFENKKIPENDKWNKYASGFIKMIYLNFNVNLTDVESKLDENGKWLSTTQMIYNYIKENGEILQGHNPKVGDIVFFDNTSDINKDNLFNDKLTSIGIVTEIDNEGTIYFLYNTSKGVKLRMINFKHPEQKSIKNKNITKVINSQMRWLTKKEKASKNSDKLPVLSSQLINSFGSILSKHNLSDLEYRITLPKKERKNIAKFAKTFENKNIPKSGRWNKYASGFVKMVFLSEKVNLTDLEKKKDENGRWFSATEKIYNYVNKHGILYKKNPKIGDIVFFDNTIDKNKDKQFNDKLTSIGIVVDIDKDETIYFLYNTSKGVKLRMINLKYPKEKTIKNKNITKVINSQMRWSNKGSEESKKYELSSQLLNSFGSIFK